VIVLPGILRTVDQSRTQPFLKLPIAAKLGKKARAPILMTPGEGADGALVVEVVVVGYHSEIGRAKPGYYGGSTPVLLTTQVRSSATSC
jgi:hypothetical protein